MKYVLIISLIFVGCAELDLTTKQVTCANSNENSYAKGDALRDILERYAQKGIPGISMAIRVGDQYWEGAGGYASIEKQIKMQPCHLLYSQSVAKTYTAVTILQLMEKGLIDLDKSMREYLPEKIWKRIQYSDKITVRMLLNHTSGMFDYAYDYGEVTYLLNNGDKVWSEDFLLEFILDKKPVFYPGTKYMYCNSGYTMLAIIAEKVTGKPHSEIIRRQILEPLGLNRTFYKEEVSATVNSGLVNSYIDRFSDGHFENISQPQMNNILSMKGDDSIVATSRDYVDFLDGLVTGKLLSPASFEMMKQWVTNSKGDLAYGLGLDYAIDEGHIAWGHSGGGLGAGCILYYYPEQNITLFLGVNMCTLLEGPATDQISEMRKEIFKVIF
jgi:D-alanyl-D-alanine carboxypeptidase